MMWMVLLVLGSLLVCTVPPSSAHNSRMYSNLESIQQEPRDDCVTVRGTADSTSVGTDIQICAKRSAASSGLCFSSTLQKCCRHTGTENEIVYHHIEVASQSIRVSTMHTENSDICVHFGAHNLIGKCLASSSTNKGGCEEPLNICSENSAGNCSPSGCKSCMAGYRGQTCCECDNGYAMYNGVCKKVCSQNVIMCGHQRCCKEGFQAPLCCECVYEYGDGGENYFWNNGHCIRICKGNAIEKNCDKKTGCTHCEDSFLPPDCCKRSTNYQPPAQAQVIQVPLPARNAAAPVTCWQFANCLGNPTVMWSSDFEGDCCGGIGQPRVGHAFQVFGLEQCFSCPLPPGTCASNIITGSCNEVSCQCKRNYTGNDCCDCASGYIHNGSGCSRCPTGTVPDDAQQQCICDQSLGTRILVNGLCRAVCSSHVVRGSCGRSSCQCVSGYTGNDCCDCASVYIRDGNNCATCPTGTVPDTTQQKCVCDQSQGPKSYVDGKCIALPEPRIVVCWQFKSCTGNNEIIRSVSFQSDCCGSIGVQGRGRSYQMAGEESCRACPVPITICNLNTVRGSCNVSSCQCVSGYTGNGCCDCASGYIRNGSGCSRCPTGTVPDDAQQQCICDQSLGTKILISGQCKAVCSSHVVRGSCGRSSCRCVSGYTGNDCCDCASGYIHDGSGCSACPTGTVPDDAQQQCICDQSLGTRILNNGKCKTVCSSHVVRGSCGRSSCQCVSGYTGNDCCDCASGYIHDGSGCSRCPTGTVPDDAQQQCICDQSLGNRILDNGQCKAVCFSHVVRGSCGRSSCQCVSGYTGNDCCDCASGYIHDGNNCATCPTGTVPDDAQQQCICDQSLETRILVNGQCKAVCSSHVVRGSCGRSSCRCVSGYTGNDCCDCASGYIHDGSGCSRCPTGTVPDDAQQLCICDQTGGTQILIDGQCKAVCSNSIVGECSMRSCKCQPGYAPPDCCSCTDGTTPVQQRCPVPCIDNQKIFILMDRSSGIGNTKLYDAMLMIEILTGAILRDTKNLTVSVLSYATSFSQTTPLLNMAPTILNQTITEERCNNILRQYEQNIVNTFPNKPQDTVAGRTMELLLPMLEVGTKNTVITFSGTLSNFDDTNNPVVRIRNAIALMKRRVGSANVKFFSVGYFAENARDSNSPRRRAQYEAEVLALAEDNASHTAISITSDSVYLMKRLIDNLYLNGVMCQSQKLAVHNLIDDYNRLKTFRAYQACIHLNRLPCISQNTYNGGCRQSSGGVEQSEESSVLSLMRQFLQRYSM